MKYAFLLMAVFLQYSLLLAQTEKTENNKISVSFRQHYNHENYDSIFSLFSPDMRAALPIDKTKQFFTGLREQAGSILSMEFSRYENGTYASYKTQFERALLSVNISLDNQSEINGLFVKAYTDVTVPVLNRNVTPMQLPFKEEWTVFWGGDTKEQNYHMNHMAQKNAFDLVITDPSGSTFSGTGEKNEDYYAFGKELIAPCDGEVVLVVDGIKDNKPGEMNPIYIPGNTVVIKTKNNEYLFFAHFKKHTIRVKEGQKVTKGQLLGLCGNSGNSSEPHLHFHIQNSEDMNTGIGAKCFFESIMVNGQLKKDHSPVRGEKVKNF